MLRLDFTFLAAIVRLTLERNEAIGSLRHGAVEPEVRLAVVLRILASASHLDLMMLWGIAQPTIYQILHYTVDA